MGKLIFVNEFIGGRKMDKKNINIKEKAKEIREQYGLIGTAINPLVITKELGIKVFQKNGLNVDGKPISGAITKENNNIIIYVNAQDNIRKKRFTIAHELGHYFLHLDKESQLVDFQRDDSNKNEEIEIEANEFASCLLMNEEELKLRYNKTQKIGLRKNTALNLLSEIFAVTNKDMLTRLNGIGCLLK